MKWYWNEFNSYFWSEQFWFPANVTWSSLENKDDGIYHPQRSDLFMVFPVAFGLFTLRKLFERFIFTPLGKRYGMKETVRRRVPHNPILQEFFKVSRFPNHDDIQGLCKETNLSTRQVERWFRLRRNQDRASLITKFTESCWRFTFYFIVVFGGLYVLWDKPWFSNVTRCWDDIRFAHVSNGIYWYYMVEMGFFWSGIFSQFIDVKRKDFWQMFIHHAVALALLLCSWCNNFVRIGTLILLLHDCGDFLLYVIKIFNYLKQRALFNVFFVCFVLVWVMTRLVIYPVWIVHNVMFVAPVIVGYCHIYFVYCICLVLLQILHIFWSVLIFKLTYTVATNSAVVKDNRSETEEYVSDDDKSAANGPKQKAG